MTIKKICIRFKVALVFLSLNILSCTTLSVPQSEGDCLLAVGVRLDGKYFKKRAPIVELIIRDRESKTQIKVITLQTRTNVALISDLSPGEYSLFVSSRPGIWDLREEKFIINVNLKPGYLTLSSGGVRILLRNVTDIMQKVSIEPFTLYSDDFERIRTELQADPNFSLWKYQEGNIDISASDEPPDPTDIPEVSPITRPDDLPEPIINPNTGM